MSQRLTKEEFLHRYALDRRGTNSVKWDALAQRFNTTDVLPLWVADMDFKVPETVTDALTTRIQQGAFGYSLISPTYHQTFIDWLTHHHGYTPKKGWLRFTNGTITTLFWILHAFTKPKDAIMMLSPVYYPFFSTPQDTDHIPICSELQRDETGRYYINFEEVEQKIKEHNVKLFILCNPHNPVSRLWSEEELTRLFTLCEQYNVLIISDEIHQDFHFDTFIPALKVQEGRFSNSIITITSASKTFNLASLPVAHVIIPNKEHRHIFDAYVKTIDHTQLSVLNLVATETAYQTGDIWLTGLLATIQSNYELLKDLLLAKAPNIKFTPLEATYLAWLDFNAYIKPDELDDFLIKECRVGVNTSANFAPATPGFGRFNLAAHPDTIKEAANRIIQGLLHRNLI
ncbi:MalY/PatB family protein [Veillonella criceti]|uniref:cysteine-S-conjugate beta-lyase n=1 Tax=Veillonella criceti TaxID=103891 RepID=A0A380NLP6_9FIRM|nr:PatB family C-S lyase [Veillonella criceti]SUP43899.1 Cystathionine beta-lyase PatB [Veillonella criceti]